MPTPCAEDATSASTTELEAPEAAEAPEANPAETTYATNPNYIGVYNI